MKCIRQTELAECGLACIAMIANHHGHAFLLSDLRRRFSISNSGARLDHIMEIGEVLNLTSRAIRCEPEELHSLKLPAILHWNLDHYVVLKSVKGQKVTILDPAQGEVKLNMDVVEKLFTGIVLEITKMADFSPEKNKGVSLKLWHLWDGLTGFKRALLQLSVLAIFIQSFVLISPLFIQIAIDKAATSFDHSFLLTLVLGFAFIYIVGGVAGAFRSYLIVYYGQHVSFQIKANLFHHLLKLPLSFFEKRHIGDLISRFESVGEIETILTEKLVASVLDFAMIFFIAIVLLNYNAKLAAVIFIFAAVQLTIAVCIFPLIRSRTQNQIIANANEGTSFLEGIRAVKTIKIFGRERQRESMWKNSYAEQMDHTIAEQKLQIINQTTQEVLSNMQMILVVYFGILAIYDNNLTVGMLVAFLSYRLNFSNSLQTLTMNAIDLGMLRLHLERLHDIVSTSPDTSTQSNSLTLSNDEVQGSLEFENVLFRYDSNLPPTLIDLSFRIEPGEFAVFVGPSGGGKSTLMKLMLGLHSPSEGKIFIDDKPMNGPLIKQWRKYIGVVMQDDQLISGTIADNITFFDSQPSVEKYTEAAKIAMIHQDIEDMPLQYYSLIGDMGSSLSGGQRQRLLLARALYKQPKILFLDEGTANLDTKTEAIIADSISSMPITRVAIAHRAELISRADRIFLIDHSVHTEISFEEWKKQQYR